MDHPGAGLGARACPRRVTGIVLVEKLSPEAGYVVSPALRSRVMLFWRLGVGESLPPPPGEPR